MKRIITVIFLIMLFSAFSYAQKENATYLLDDPDCPLKLTKASSDEENDVYGMRVYFENTGKKTIYGFKFRVVSFTMFKRYYTTSFYFSHNQNLTPSRKDYFFFATAPKQDPEYVKRFNNIVIVEELLFSDNTIWSRTDYQPLLKINELMGSNFSLDDLVDNFGEIIEFFITGSVIL